MTKRLFIQIFNLPALLLVLSGLVWTSTGWAIDLQTAKAQGLVGEQPNGYLGLVKPGAGSDVKNMMTHINAARKSAYQAISKRNNTELGVVETLAGKKAIEKTPAGQYIKLPSGKWVKK